METSKNTLYINCDKIVLKQNSIDASLECESTKFHNLDKIVINGVEFNKAQKEESSPHYDFTIEMTYKVGSPFAPASVVNLIGAVQYHFCEKIRELLGRGATNAFFTYDDGELIVKFYLMQLTHEELTTINTHFTTSTHICKPGLCFLTLKEWNTSVRRF